MATALRFFKLLRMSLWRAFNHDAFGIAKGAAYSSLVSLFPGLLVVAAVLAALHKTVTATREISYVIGRILPPGSAQAAQSYFHSTTERPVSVLIMTSILTLWAASGIMISWMEGFRNAYQLPKTWGVVKERLISFSLVFMAGIPLVFATALVAFGTQFELWTMHRAGHQFGPYILLLWKGTRWVIASLTSVAVISLIYHNAVPRTLRWHTVLPGAALATALWFPSTALFGWYVGHFAEYSLLYGSFATAIVLLIWMYIISIVILIGAELNAILYPRSVALPASETDNGRSGADSNGQHKVRVG
jgi:membrane protein